MPPEYEREWIIDTAPGKDLIGVLQSMPDSDTLERFLRRRLDWCGGYPLVHDYLVTVHRFGRHLEWRQVATQGSQHEAA